MIINKLKWISSSKKENEKELEELNNKLVHFYSSLDGRDNYQKMIDSTHNNESNFVSQTSEKFSKLLMSANFNNILEFGCGSGKLYNKLIEKGFKGKYTGYEMADYVIEDNKVKMPNATWVKGSIYDETITVETFDCCFSFFVLEHLVYPERALNNMIRIIKPGGSIFLVFPDMVESLIFSSQKIGINKLSGIKNKLKSFKFLDAIITYLETKSFQNNLRSVNEKYGDFVVNLDPICFDKNDSSTLLPDMDAVYIASAEEVAKWAKNLNYQVVFPMGREGQLKTNPFIQIIKKEA